MVAGSGDAGQASWLGGGPIRVAGSMTCSTSCTPWATPACGTVSAAETVAVAQAAAHAQAQTAATRPWIPRPSDFTDSHPFRSKLSAEEVAH